MGTNYLDLEFLKFIKRDVVLGCDVGQPVEFPEGDDSWKM